MADFWMNDYPNGLNFNYDHDIEQIPFERIPFRHECFSSLVVDLALDEIADLSEYHSVMSVFIEAVLELISK